MIHALFTLKGGYRPAVIRENIVLIVLAILAGMAALAALDERPLSLRQHYAAILVACGEFIRLHRIDHPALNSAIRVGPAG